MKLGRRGGKCDFGEEVLQALESDEIVRGGVDQKRVAVVEARVDKGTCEEYSVLLREERLNVTNSPNMIEGRFGGRHRMSRRRELSRG